MIPAQAPFRVRGAPTAAGGAIWQDIA